jgi:hypothetical protein
MVEQGQISPLNADEISGFTEGSDCKNRISSTIDPLLLAVQVSEEGP